MKTLHCGDLMKGCDFVATGATEDEVMKKAAEHAKSAHGMHHLPPETALTALNTKRRQSPGYIGVSAQTQAVAPKMMPADQIQEIREASRIVLSDR